MDEGTLPIRVVSFKILYFKGPPFTGLFSKSAVFVSVQLNSQAFESSQLEEYAAHPLVHSNNQLLARQMMATLDKNDPILPIDCQDSVHPLVTTTTQQLYFVGKQKLDAEEK